MQDGAIAGQSARSMRAAFAPKEAAAARLLEAAAASPLQGVALFSSVAGQLGSAGQANYGAANAALDAQAERLQAQVCNAAGMGAGCLLQYG
jgi:KR domain